MFTGIITSVGTITAQSVTPAGRLIEVNEADELLTNPRHRLTEAYVTGRIA